MMIFILVALGIYILGEATTAGISKREYTKDTIKTLLYEPVYMQGMSLEAARSKYPDMYRNHPNLFVQYYQDLLSMRAADLEAGTHPISERKNEQLLNQYLALGVVVIMLLFINEIYN